MKIYFRLMQVPELSHFPRDMREAVVERCFAHAAQIPASRVAPFAVLPLGLINALLLYIVIFVVAESLDHRLRLALAEVMLYIVLPAITLSAGILPMAVRSDRLRLRRAIALFGKDNRLPICARCDYDLRGTTGEACPECGAPTKLVP